MSNLIKTSILQVEKQEKRIIDTNELMESRMAKIREELAAENNTSFSPGIFAEQIDPADALFADPGLDGNIGNIIGEDGFKPIGTNIGSYDGEVIGEGYSADASADEIISEAQAKGDEIIQRSILQAQEILAKAQEDAKKEAGAIRIEAEKRGYADGKTKADLELRRMQEELNQQAQQLELQYEQQVEEIEPLLVEKITDIYQYFFGVDLSSKRQILLHLISNAMRHIDGSKNFLIHVSREDIEYVGSHKDQILSAAISPGSVVEVIEDISLRKNECMIETDGGIFDCSLDTELKELSRRLRLLSY